MTQSLVVQAQHNIQDEPVELPVADLQDLEDTDSEWDDRDLEMQADGENTLWNGQNEVDEGEYAAEMDVDMNDNGDDELYAEHWERLCLNWIRSRDRTCKGCS